MKIKECPTCVKYYYEHPFLAEACATVAIAIDSDKSSQDLMIAFMSAYHHDGHRDPLENVTWNTILGDWKWYGRP